MTALLMPAFGPMPTLETERLLLRPLTLADARAVFDGYASDPEVARFMMWEAHRSLDDTRAFIELELARYAAGEPGSWAIIHRADGRLIGAGGYVSWLRAHHRAEIGYVLARAMWGQGLMPEAARAIVASGFDRGLGRMEIWVKEPNRASQRVAEKLGFQLEGKLRAYRWAHGQPWDYRLYAMLRENWPQA